MYLSRMFSYHFDGVIWSQNGLRKLHFFYYCFSLYENTHGIFAMANLHLSIIQWCKGILIARGAPFLHVYLYKTLMLIHVVI